MQKEIIIQSNIGISSLVEPLTRCASHSQSLELHRWFVVELVCLYVVSYFWHNFNKYSKFSQFNMPKEKLHNIKNILRVCHQIETSFLTQVVTLGVVITS